MINIRQFRHFLAVLETGSFLGASKTMNISQPALSKSIASIESFYNVPLFKRLPRGVEPTGFALTLEPHARRILHDVAESRAEMASVAAGSAGGSPSARDHPLSGWYPRRCATLPPRCPMRSSRC